MKGDQGGKGRHWLGEGWRMTILSLLSGFRVLGGSGAKTSLERVANLILPMARGTRVALTKAQSTKKSKSHENHVDLQRLES